MAPAARTRQRPTKPNTNSSEFDYNADARTEKRAKGKITIGDKVFHRRVKDNDVSQQLLDLQEDQELANRKAAALEGQITELEPDDLDGYQELRGRLREETEVGREKGYESLALLLQDEAGVSPPLDLIRKMDQAEVVNLINRIAAGGEGLDPPTGSPSRSD